jgi:hypothetical protein
MADEKSNDLAIANSSDESDHNNVANEKHGVEHLKMPIANPDDPNAPSTEISSTKQKWSNIFTIWCAGFALISDGYQSKFDGFNLQSRTKLLTEFYRQSHVFNQR